VTKGGRHRGRDNVGNAATSKSPAGRRAGTNAEERKVSGKVGRNKHKITRNWTWERAKSYPLINAKMGNEPVALSRGRSGARLANVKAK